MTNSQMDIIKSDPIETLNKASSISLNGGGALLVFAGVLIYQSNEAGWKVSPGLIYLLIIGAILMGVLSVSLRVIDVTIRSKLALKLLGMKGTSDPEEAKSLPVIPQIHSDILNRLLDKDKPLVSYIIAPGKVEETSTDPPS